MSSTGNQLRKIIKHEDNWEKVNRLIPHARDNDVWCAFVEAVDMERPKITAGLVLHRVIDSWALRGMAGRNISRGGSVEIFRILVESPKLSDETIPALSNEAWFYGRDQHLSFLKRLKPNPKGSTIRQAFLNVLAEITKKGEALSPQEPCIKLSVYTYDLFPLPEPQTRPAMNGLAASERNRDAHCL